MSIAIRQCIQRAQLQDDVIWLIYHTTISRNSWFVTDSMIQNVYQSPALFVPMVRWVIVQSKA